VEPSIIEYAVTTTDDPVLSSFADDEIDCYIKETKFPWTTGAIIQNGEDASSWDICSCQGQKEVSVDCKTEQVYG
jgi:hypothetical protein